MIKFTINLKHNHDWCNSDDEGKIKNNNYYTGAEFYEKMNYYKSFYHFDLILELETILSENNINNNIIKIIKSYYTFSESEIKQKIISNYFCSSSIRLIKQYCNETFNYSNINETSLKKNPKLEEINEIRESIRRFNIPVSIPTQIKNNLLNQQIILNDN